MESSLIVHHSVVWSGLTLLTTTLLLSFPVCYITIRHAVVFIICTVLGLKVTPLFGVTGLLLKCKCVTICRFIEAKVFRQCSMLQCLPGFSRKGCITCGTPWAGLPGAGRWCMRDGIQHFSRKAAMFWKPPTEKCPFHKGMLGRLGSATSENVHKSGELSCPYSVPMALWSVWHQVQCREGASQPSLPCWGPEAARQKGGRAALLFPLSTAQLLTAWQSGRISADDLLCVSPWKNYLQLSLHSVHLPAEKTFFCLPVMLKTAGSSGWSSSPLFCKRQECKLHVHVCSENSLSAWLRPQWSLFLITIT